jgi:hypothetical protein
MGDTAMRFMLMLKGDPPPGAMPPPDLVQAMHEYHAELDRAGVLLAAEGLYDSSMGARVIYAKGDRTVVDGPFTEAKELIAGWWLLEVDSREEAIEWIEKAPFGGVPGGFELEVRQVADDDDLGEAFTPELHEQEARIRAKVEANIAAIGR